MSKGSVEYEDRQEASRFGCQLQEYYLILKTTL